MPQQLTLDLNTDNTAVIGRFPARLLQRATPTADLLDMLRQYVDDVESLEPFIFPAEISSNRLDSYFTHMDASTLVNFANAAREGRSFLDSHDGSKLGLGYSLAGRFEQQGDVLRTVADFYTVPGVEFGGRHSYRSTDDFIKAVKTGLARDVSVGFYGGKWTCDICGGDWHDYTQCIHWPGVEYAIGDQGNQTVVCTVTIEDAQLSEVSAVYDGATPGAMILKAERMAEAGKLSHKSARLLEVRYNIQLPQVRQLWPTATVSSSDNTTNVTYTPEANGRAVTEPEAPDAPEGGGETDPPTPLDNVADGREETFTEETYMNEQAIRDALATIGIDEAIPVEDGVQQAVARYQDARDQVTAVRELLPEGAPEGATVAEAVRWLTGEVARLRPLADDGRRYKDDLITAALAEGVRALGETFSRETYEAILRGADIETIKRMRDDWKTVGDARFPGGRQIVDEDVDAETAVEDTEPDRAYAA